MLKNGSVGFQFLKCLLSQVKSGHRELGRLSEQVIDIMRGRQQKLENRKDLTI